MMSNWKRVMVPTAALVMLSACGGGGGGGGNDAESLGDKSFPSAAPTQTYADGAVTEVNGLIEEINQAEQSGSIVVPVAMVSAPVGASYAQTYQCSELFGNGSGTARISVVTDSNDDLRSLSVTYNDCSYTSGGTTYTFDGKYSFKYTDFVDDTHWTLTYSYDLTYSITGSGINESGTLKTAQVCERDGEDTSCRYAVGGGYALGDYDVDRSGDIITVNYAFIESANATIEINDWVYNTATGRATSGTIEVTFANGNSVLITATGTGYTVAVTIGGNTTNYEVSFT